MLGPLEPELNLVLEEADSRDDGNRVPEMVGDLARDDDSVDRTSRPELLAQDSHVSGELTNGVVRASRSLELEDVERSCGVCRKDVYWPNRRRVLHAIATLLIHVESQLQTVQVYGGQVLGDEVPQLDLEAKRSFFGFI